MKSDRKTLLGWAACLLVAGLLSGCSPSPSSDNDSSDTASTDSPAAEGGASENDQLMSEDGWRKGVLKIDIEMKQKGHGEESGRSVMTANWETAITASSEQPVWVAKDLRLFISEKPDAETYKNALNYEPYRYIENAPEAKPSGTFAHKADFSLKDPEAADLINIEKQVTETGVIDRISLNALHPSLYGAGYEASVDLKILGHRKLNETMTRRNEAPYVNNEEKEVNEDHSWYLHPVPAQELNDYPYIPDLTPDDLKAQIIKRNQDMLDTLKQVYADTFPVQSQMRAGAISSATKDQLVLTYEYNGDKQLPFIPAIEMLSGKASPNLLKITITLSAK